MESATLESEISMSIAPTDDTRTLVQVVRRRAGSAAADFAASASTSSESTVVVTDQTAATGCCSSGRCSRRWAVNAEPVIVLVSAYGSLTTVGTLFLFWARCIEIFKTPETPMPGLIPENVTALCASLGDANNTKYSDQVEADIAQMQVYLQLANTLPMLISATILGAWADGSGGRRLPMLFGLFSSVFFGSLQLIAMFTYKQFNVYYLYFASYFINGLLGSGSTTFACAFAIVTDDSRHQLKEGRSSVPIRIGIASAGQMIGGFLGNLILNLLMRFPMTTIEERETAYIRASCVGLGLLLIAILYALLFVKETNAPRQQSNSNGAGVVSQRLVGVDRSVSSISSVSCGKRARAFIYDLVSVMVEPRPGWTRFCLNLSVLAVFAEFVGSDQTVFFLLVKRSPLDWSDSTYSTYTMLKTFMMSLGMILLPLTLGRTKWILGKDSILIIVATSAGAVASMIPAFSQSTNAILFGTSALYFLFGGMSPGYRSFLPRMVTKEQTARLFTAFTIIVGFCPLVGTAVFTNIFRLTMDVWPGFALFVAGICQFGVFLTQVLIHFLMRPLWIEQRELRNRRHTAGGDDLFAVGTMSDETTASPARARSRSISTTAVNSSEGETDYEDDQRPLLAY